VELLLVRHAVAEEVDAYSGEDARRSLTAEGRRKFERAARGLRREVEAVGLVATSPLARAVQTAEILAAVCGLDAPVVLEELAPDAQPGAFVAWLRRRRPPVVAAVGHEPHLSRLVAHLLPGGDPGGIALKKGGGCLLTFEGRPEAGGATLRWLLTGRQLRRLGA
jgi:phosphohistidine phosphatase